MLLVLDALLDLDRLRTPESDDDGTLKFAASLAEMACPLTSLCLLLPVLALRLSEFWETLPPPFFFNELLLLLLSMSELELFLRRLELLGRRREPPPPPFVSGD